MAVIGSDQYAIYLSGILQKQIQAQENNELVNFVVRSGCIESFGDFQQGCQVIKRWSRRGETKVGLVWLYRDDP